MSLTTTADMTVTRKRRRSLVFLQVFLVAGLLLLGWVSFGKNVLAPASRESVPRKLGSLELVGSIEGAEAMAQIDKLHGTEVNLVSAYIAHYERGGEGAMVWVGTAENSEAAATLLDKMVAGIAGGNSGFNNLKRMTVAQAYHSHDVFQADGPGGKHFFYLSGKSGERIVWLTVEASDTQPILEQAIKTF